MSQLSLYRVLGSTLALTAAQLFAAEQPPAKAAPPASAQKSRTSTARGPLPDPALLDGAAQKADKQSENGMLGEFEIPGDEDVRNGQVGGPEKANPQAAQNPNLPQNGGSPQGTQSAAAGGIPGAAGGPEAPAGQQGGAAAAAGAQANQKGGAIPGGGDPNATAQGIQVADLQGGAQGGAPGDMPQKPPPVAIGDSAMQIQGIQNAPSVVGGQVATQTQQMEKAVGGSGKGGTGNNGNRGAEKGRVMPSGL